MFKTREGGGGQGPFKQCLKKLHNWFGMASLRENMRHRFDLIIAPKELFRLKNKMKYAMKKDTTQKTHTTITTFRA